MLSQRSFRFSLLTLLTLLCLPHVIVAQLSIQNISTNTAIDLYKMHNGDSVIDPISTLFSWQIYNERGPIPRAFYNFDENVEIIAGPAEAAGNDVVDIVATHLVSSTTTYWFPASLPLGLYHARINSNITSTSSSDGFKNYQISARSPTINVTTSFPIGCGPKVPSPFTNVASPSSPAFTSINIHEPSAGKNVVLSDNTSLPPLMNIKWQYRDQRNVRGAGISDVSAQIIDSTTSTPIGPPQKPLSSSSSGFMAVKFADVPMTVGGSYRVVLTYKNNIQDGPVSPGNVVTVTTQDFNVVRFEDWQNHCENVAADSSSGTGGSGSGSGNRGSGSPNGGRKSFGEMNYRLLLLTGVWSIVYAYAI